MILFNYVRRSEIHEKMNCIRCQNHDDRPKSIENGGENQPIGRSWESDHYTSDIGGFAEIAGCLRKLKSSEKQVGNPFPG